MLANLFRAAIVAICLIPLAALLADAHPRPHGRDLQRLLVFTKKRPDLTYDQFYEHWIDIHAPKVAPWIVKHKIETYTRIHTRPEVKAQFSNSTFPYDGFAEFEFTDLKLFLEAVADPYYANVIAKDEGTFLDKSATASINTNATSTLGIVKPVVAKGKIVLGK